MYPALRRHGIPLGLALALGAALRLIWANDAVFYSDQAELLWLGRSAAASHAFILTGIISSIDSLNPPLSTWVYAPFSLLGSQGPIAATIFTALLNVAAIGLLYAIATRYGGRRAGFVAALLYATASGAVHYARFVWQQNLLAPVLLLLLGALMAGLVERRAGWLGWAALFWGMAVQLHPTAAALLAAIAFVLLFTWRDLRWRDLVWAGVALTVLFAPTLLWEVVSHGADLISYRLLATLKPVYDIAGPYQYKVLISPAAPDLYGAGSSYVPIGDALVFLGPMMEILALGSLIWLGATTITPWVSGKRTPGGPRVVMATPRWQIGTILLLWQVVPILTLIRHNVGIPTHYLLVLAPIIYLSIGLWAAAASSSIETKLARYRAAAAQFAPIGLVAVTLALAMAQTVGVTAELTAIHDGWFARNRESQSVEYPLSSEESALSIASSRATAENAILTIASSIQQVDAYTYVAQANAVQATVYESDSCLIAPARGSARPMVTLAQAGTQAMAALPTLNDAQALGSLSAPVSPSTLYLIQPGAGPRNEVALPTPISVAGPRPTAYSYGAAASGQTYITLRWSGAPTLTQRPEQRPLYWFGATADGPLVANYTVTAQRLDNAGQPIGAPLTASCGRLRWQSGIDLLAWLPLPATAPSGMATWRVSLSAALAETLRPRIGPLTLETGDTSFAHPQPITEPFTIETKPGV